MARPPTTSSPPQSRQAPFHGALGSPSPTPPRPAGVTMGSGNRTSPPHVTTLGWITSTIEVGGSRTGGTSLSMASTGLARLTRGRDPDADAPAAPRRSDPPGSRWAPTRSPMPPRPAGVTMGSGNVRLLLTSPPLVGLRPPLRWRGPASAGPLSAWPRPARPTRGRDSDSDATKRSVGPRPGRYPPPQPGGDPPLPLDCRSPLAGFDPRQRLRLNSTRRDFVPAHD